MSWQRLQDVRLQKRLQTRSRIIQLIRDFFVREGFLEIETPIAVPAAGQEPYLNPNETKIWDHRSPEIPAYLITSPEYAHKKLLAAGFKKTFEITRCFRSGEPWDGLHNPEFTMIEWYRAHADYTKIMNDVEKMVQYVWQNIIASPEPKQAWYGVDSAKQSRRSPRSLHSLAMTLYYQDHHINLSSPWQRLTMQEAWEKYADTPKCANICDRKYLRGLCQKRGYTVSAKDSYDDLFFKIFLTDIEPKLGFSKPTILYEYPAQMAALARTVAKPRGASGLATKQIAERFEIYIAGIELGNAFSELTDAREQRARFIEEQKLRKKLNKKVIPLDEDFLDAVGHMPSAAGIAFGIDRLVMLLTDAKSIQDVLAFPATELWPCQKIKSEI